MPSVWSHFPPSVPPDQPIKHFGSHLSAQLLLQVRPHSGQYHQFASFGLGLPVGNKLFLFGYRKQGVTSSSPRLAGNRLGCDLRAKLSLQPMDCGSADTKDCGGLLQAGTEQGRQQYGLRRPKLMQVRRSGHHLLGLSHQC